MKPTEQHQPPPPPPPPPLPDSDVVFASYSIAGPTGVINTDVSLPTPATVPIRDPDELQNPYEDPMQPEQAGNNVIFTGYALARRASESDHKYQYLETTCAGYIAPIIKALVAPYQLTARLFGTAGGT